MAPFTMTGGTRAKIYNIFYFFNLAAQASWVGLPAQFKPAQNQTH